MTSPVVVSRIQNRRGTQSQFDALYPAGYTGTDGVDINLWPNVLKPGELAFCIDSRRTFIGNINGEYVELGAASPPAPPSGEMTPVTMVLTPTQLPAAPPIFSHIASLDYQATPFFNMLYDVTDTLNPDWNTLGTTFSRNGSLMLTATSTLATLSDTSSEINISGSFLSFQAVLSLPVVQIWYSHDHTSNLTFSTSSIRWLPF
jgi:hypothetical protein